MILVKNIGKGLKRRGFTGKVCLYRDEKNIRCCTESEKQYLIVQNLDEAYMEFPDIISKGYKMPEDDTFLLLKRLAKFLEYN